MASPRPSESANLMRTQFGEDDDKEYFYRNYGRRSIWIQKITTCLVVVVIIVIFILLALAATIEYKVEHFRFPSTVTTAYPALGLPGIRDYSWNDIESLAPGQTVNFWMYNGSAAVNRWVDTVLVPKMKSQYNINVNRNQPNGLTAAKSAATRVEEERAAGNHKDGSVDLIWINGENFSRMKSKGNLYGPWSTKLPNSVNYNFASDVISYDFGNPIEGYEMPYTGAQIVFIYNSNFVNATTDIQSMDDLVEWTKNNPGRFTYAQPQSADGHTYDYTGSAFIRHFLYEFCGSDVTKCSYKQYLGKFNTNAYTQNAKYAFNKLKEMEPYLYGCSVNGCTYPTAQVDVDAAFASGQIWITLSYDPGHAGAMVDAGTWPDSTRTWVPASGTIANTNYVAIPYNAANLYGALVVSNYIASMSAQFTRRNPDIWGSLQVYSQSCDAIQKEGWGTAFTYLDDHLNIQTLTNAQLSKVALPELNAEYTNRIQSDWQLCVAQKSSVSPCV